MENHKSNFAAKVACGHFCLSIWETLSPVYLSQIWGSGKFMEGNKKVSSRDRFRHRWFK